ncbi:4,5-dioxygenase, partial [Pseudomonas sp. MWU12-2115]
WSCQLAFAPEVFAQVVPWLALNRQGLVVFLHPDTGDDLLDHTEHAIWMGAMRPLDLTGF